MHYLIKTVISLKNLMPPPPSESAHVMLEHFQALTTFDIKTEKCDLPTFYWLPKLHKMNHIYQIQVTVTLANIQNTLHPRFFKTRIIISKKYQPPPPQNQMVVPFKKRTLC